MVVSGLFLELPLIRLLLLTYLLFLDALSACSNCPNRKAWHLNMAFQTPI